MKTKFLLTFLVSFVVLALVVSVGRWQWFDRWCFDRVQTQNIGGHVLTTHTCQGQLTSARYSMGYPAFYTYNGPGEFGSSFTEFNFWGLLINLVWVGAVSFFLATLIGARARKPTSATQPTKPSGPSTGSR